MYTKRRLQLTMLGSLPGQSMAPWSTQMRSNVCMLLFCQPS